MKKRRFAVQAPKAHGHAIVPGSEWIVMHAGALGFPEEVRFQIVGRAKHGPGWWGYTLGKTCERFRVRSISQLLRPAPCWQAQSYSSHAIARNV
jgi:hypothetical protein